MKPRRGHIDQVFHIFGYLKRNKRATIVFDESYVNWNEDQFKHTIGGTFIEVLRKCPFECSRAKG